MPGACTFLIIQDSRKFLQPRNPNFVTTSTQKSNEFKRFGYQDAASVVAGENI